MAELHWFPAYNADWLGSAAINAMLPEQEGAYWRLLNIAWGNGEAEPSLPSDATALAQMSRLASRWKKLGPAIVSQFELRGGRLYNRKLSAIWADQQVKHAKAVDKASKGGKAKAELERARRTASGSAPSTASSTAQAQPEARSKPANQNKSTERTTAPGGERVSTSDSKHGETDDPAAFEPLSFADLPPAAREFITTLYPRASSKPERRTAVAQQLLDTLGEGARLNGSAQRVRAQSLQRLEAKCREVLASPLRDPDKAIVVLLKKLADTSDGSAPGQRAEASAASERQDDERTGAQRTALAEAWLDTQPEATGLLRQQLAADPSVPKDPADPLFKIMRRAALWRLWSEAGEPEVQHA